MPGGRPPKPIALHQIQGTFRPDRHARGAALEARLVAPQPVVCSFCGKRQMDDFPLATNNNETVTICPNCVAGAMIAFDKMDWDMLPDEILPGYVERCDQCGCDKLRAVEPATTAPNTGSKLTENAAKSADSGATDG